MPVKRTRALPIDSFPATVAGSRARVTGGIGGRLRCLLPVALLLVVVALAAGCGSSNSAQPATPTDWASGVCSAISTWTASLTSAAAPLKSGNLSKDALTTAAADMKSATQTLVSSLKKLGKPNTQAGQQAKDSIDQLSSDVQKDADTIKTAIDGISGLSSIPGAVSTASSTLVTMQGQVTSTISTLEQLDAKGELQTAFKQSSSCQKLSSSK